MKLINFFIVLIAPLMLLSSCKKDELEIEPMGSITIVNAVVSGKNAFLGSYIGAIQINLSSKIALPAGETNLYVWPLGDSLHPYFTADKFMVEKEAVYSLFLCGSLGATEGVLFKDNIPYRKDSTAGIRFVNLAPNKPSVNITLATTPGTNEVSGLAYKGYTEFKTYPGLYNSSYIFQVREAANPSVILATYALSAASVPRFANISLVIRQNGTGVSVFKVANDRVF